MHTERTIEEILGRLVGFDTTSRNSNLPLIDWVDAWLQQFGVQGERVFNADGNKANFYATIGPADQPGYILSGHTDTVPVDGQNWLTDPYTLTRQGDQLFGRGTVDMKGFLACCLSRVPQLVAADLKAPVHLAFSYDEEVGCQGVPGLLEVLCDRPVKPKACFVGEPSSMEVVVAHKAKQSYRAEFTGLACHSSQAPHGVNAVSYAARLVQFVDSVAIRLGEGVQGELYDVPVSTAHVGVMRGGTALNIVPERAVVDFEFRVLPTEDIDVVAAEVAYFAASLDAEMKQRNPDCGVQLSRISAFPGLDTDPEAEVVRLACQLADDPKLKKVAYGTEAGLFSTRLGVPTVVVGPGSINQAHKPNEFVDIEQLERCGAFVDRLLEHCRG
ncbi:acetylornithine deacetylase [Natronospirillum operosum]|uniref:Acetylornithine deacetylase n=2 Tax=Natronospirillum operosum TaxID=2759953 RepID=A0A4Z0WB44_9GAMM|nr:acetylornithine deacetylase [Natronospirillum operosum]